MTNDNDSRRRTTPIEISRLDAMLEYERRISSLPPPPPYEEEDGADTLEMEITKEIALVLESEVFAEDPSDDGEWI